MYINRMKKTRFRSSKEKASYELTCFSSRQHKVQNQTQVKYDSDRKQKVRSNFLRRLWRSVQSDFAALWATVSIKSLAASLAGSMKNKTSASWEVLSDSFSGKSPPGLGQHSGVTGERCVAQTNSLKNILMIIVHTGIIWGVFWDSLLGDCCASFLRESPTSLADGYSTEGPLAFC